MASVEQRRNDWRVVWRQDKTKQYECFGSQSEAEQFVAMLDAHGGRWPYGWVKGKGFTQAPSGAPTFRVWARQCIDSRSTANERTRHDYWRDIERHLLPTFGETPIDRIAPDMVGRWLIAMSKTCSPKTVKNVHSLASSIMADAIAEQRLGVNSFKGKMRGQVAVKQEEMVFLTRGEFDTLLRYVTDRYRPLVLVLAYTGLRWSEATALRVGDVDLLAKRLTVVRAWKRTPENSFVIGEPKSRRSRRTLVFPAWLAAELIPLLSARAAHEYVFTTALGHPVRHNNFRTRAWVPALAGMQRCAAHVDAAEPCGCPGTVPKQPRIHDLRHSHASWLIADKVSLPAIQRRLGHESITTTVDRYGHLLPDIDAEIAGVLESWAPESLGHLTPAV